MALPSNEHHVHSPGYTSSQGDPDPMRMLQDVVDEIEAHDGVSDVHADEGIDGPYVEVEYDGEQSVLFDIEGIVDRYGCSIRKHNADGGWLEVTPL